MKFRLSLYSLVFICLFTNCKQSGGTSNENYSNTSYYTSSTYHQSNYSSDVQINKGYQDGDYCATVQYYYSRTGIHSTYTLRVRIEGNELVKIFWPIGGWLDDSHFTPPDISDGSASFMSERGMSYTVTILDGEDDCSQGGVSEDEDDSEVDGVQADDGDTGDDDVEEAADDQE